MEEHELTVLLKIGVSNLEEFYQEIKNLKHIFRNNYYSVNFTDFCIKKYLDNLYVKKELYFWAPKNS